MYCNKCGNKLEDDMLFCNKCGNKAINISEEENIGNKKKSSKVFIIIVIILFISTGVYIGGLKIKKILLSFYNNVSMKQENGNMMMLLRDGSKKDISISEKDLKEKVNSLMYLISRYYSKAKINQVNEIKIIYNYNENIIEYVYLSVNLDRYYKVKNLDIPNNFVTASVEASLSRNGVYTDKWKESNGDNSLIFAVNNLSNNCGLLTEENNNVLVKIKNELNNGRDRTFYWNIKVE